MATWERVLTTASNGILPVASGGTGAADNTTARDNLGLERGVDVQEYSGILQGIVTAGTPTDDYILVGNGSNWIKETGSTARTSLGATTLGSNLFTATNNSSGNKLVSVSASNVVSLSTAATTRSWLGVVNGADVTSANTCDTPGLLTTGTQTIAGTKTFSTSPFVDTSTGLTLSLDSSHAQGGYLRLMKDGAAECYLGRRGAVSGGGGTGYDMYTAAGNDFRILTGAALALTLDTSQNSTFAGKIQFDCDEISTGDSRGLVMRNHDASQIWGIRTGRSGANNADFAIYDETDDATRMYIDGSGNTTFGGTVTATTFVGALTGNASGTSANVTGTVAVANGGTGATSASAARTNLGLALASNGVQDNLSTIPTVNDVYEFVVVQGYSTATGVANNADVTGSNICARPLTTNAQTIAGAKTFSSAITWSGGGSANANTAYGWGNHASAGYTTHTGDITGVTAGTGMSGGGTSGTVTLNCSITNNNQLTNGAGYTTNTGTVTGTVSESESVSTIAKRTSNGYFHASYFNGTGTFSTSGASSGMGIFTGTNGSDTYGRSYNSTAARALLNVANGATNVTNNNQISNGAGYTTSVGDITGVTAGTNLSGGGTSGSVTINLASASSLAKGAVELATTAETTTGTDPNRAVTPDGLKDGYEGSANIDTVGVISSGEWRGTAIDGTYVSTLNQNTTGSSASCTGNSATTSETTITNLQATAISANSLKTSNVTHTGNVTGSTALTISDNVITGDMLTTGAIDHPSKLAADVVGAAAIGANEVGASELNVSGNGSAGVSFLRSDGDGTMTWATPTSYLSTTSPLSNDYDGTTPNLHIQNDNGSSSQNIFETESQGSIQMSVTVNGCVKSRSLGVGTASSGTTGEIRATNEVTAYYSDDRLKNRYGNIKDSLDKVCSLNGFHYQPNEVAGELGYDTSTKKVGVSAQEVLKVLPEAVVPAPIDPKYHTVQYDKLIPLLIESIKELTAKVTRLEDGNS